MSLLKAHFCYSKILNKKRKRGKKMRRIVNGKKKELFSLCGFGCQNYGNGKEYDVRLFYKKSPIFVKGRMEDLSGLLIQKLETVGILLKITGLTYRMGMVDIQIEVNGKIYYGSGAGEVGLVRALINALNNM